MSKFNRRLFLERAAIGVAAVGGALALPHRANAAPQRPAAGAGLIQPNCSRAVSSSADPAAAQPIVAYVRDSSTGQMSLFIGTREVQISDADLVRRLTQAGA
jgi:hypothetical protein